MKYLTHVLGHLQENNQSLSPLTEEEVEKVKDLAEMPLPLAYQEFLMTMGKGAGKFMRGSDVFYDRIFELQAWGEELVRENNFKDLPANSFVFWMHQGYQMAFFILTEGDNPPIYFYGEGSGQADFDKKGTLVEFFEIQLKFSGLVK